MDDITKLYLEKVSNKEETTEKFTWGQALVVNTKGGTKNCAKCILLVKQEGEETSVCGILGLPVKEPNNTVCGYFVPGKPVLSESFKVGKYVTPKEAGLAIVKGGTKCGNCIMWKNEKCKIVEGTLKSDNCCALWVNDELEEKS